MISMVMQVARVASEIWCMGCRQGEGRAATGMVLPFDPMTMTFKDLHYYVPIPKVRCYTSPSYLLHHPGPPLPPPPVPNFLWIASFERFQ